MNTSPEPDPDFESLLRRQASRLAAPDPAWREKILHAALTSDSHQASNHRRRKFYGWGSLAACWAATLLLNWSAERETKRFSQYANAQATSMVMAGWNQPVLLAAASAR
jgi:hypothetical protein